MEGHEYRECVRACSKEYKDNKDHIGAGKLEPRIEKCLERCREKLPGSCTTLTTTTSTP